MLPKEAVDPCRVHGDGIGPDDGRVVNAVQPPNPGRPSSRIAVWEIQLAPGQAFSLLENLPSDFRIRQTASTREWSPSLTGEALHRLRTVVLHPLGDDELPRGPVVVRGGSTRWARGGEINPPLPVHQGIRDAQERGAVLRPPPFRPWIGRPDGGSLVRSLLIPIDHHGSGFP